MTNLVELIIAARCPFADGHAPHHSVQLP